MTDKQTVRMSDLEKAEALASATILSIGAQDAKLAYDLAVKLSALMAIEPPRARMEAVHKLNKLLGKILVEADHKE